MPDFKALTRTPQGWLLLAGIIFSILMTNACHEGGHALVAWWSGDRRPSIRRRVTLNPIAHFHWFLTLVLPLISMWFFGFMVGGARPVMVNAGKIGPRRMALVALAGPTGNFLFVGFCTFLMGLLLATGVIDEFDQVSSLWWRLLVPATVFSVLLGFLNLTPFPPLDASRVVGMFMGERTRAIWYALAPLGLILVLAVWLWFSGAFYYEFGIKSFGPGYPNLLNHDLPAWLEESAIAMGGFLGRYL